MLTLPVDERGYPIPWFVAYKDGKPEFRAMDVVKLLEAIKKKLCWVCGQPLGVDLCFVVGPMCGINRNTAEPPSHLECGRWSAINCPFLSNPLTVRREDEVMNNENFRENAPGIALARNPEVTLLWITRSFEIYRHNGKPLFTMGTPTNVEWYHKGRPATRAEVIAAVENGLPNLETIARTEKGGMAFLEVCKKRFEPYIPKE